MISHQVKIAQRKLQAYQSHHNGLLARQQDLLALPILTTQQQAELRDITDYLPISEAELQQAKQAHDFLQTALQSPVEPLQADPARLVPGQGAYDVGLSVSGLPNPHDGVIVR